MSAAFSSSAEGLCCVVRGRYATPLAITASTKGTWFMGCSEYAGNIVDYIYTDTCTCR